MVYFVTDTNWMFLAFSAFYVTFFIYCIPWIMRAIKPNRSWKKHYLWRALGGPSAHAKPRAAGKRHIEPRCKVKAEDAFGPAWGILAFFLILDMFFFISYNGNTVLNDPANYNATLGVIIAPILFPVVAAIWSYYFFKAYKGRGYYILCAGFALFLTLATAVWGMGSSAWLIANLYGDTKAIPYSDPTYPTMAVVCFAWTLTSAWVLVASIWYWVLVGKAHAYARETAPRGDCEQGAMEEETMIEHPMEQELATSEPWPHSPRKGRGSKRGP